MSDQHDFYLQIGLLNPMQSGDGEGGGVVFLGSELAHLSLNSHNLLLLNTSIVQSGAIHRRADDTYLLTICLLRKSLLTKFVPYMIW